MKGFVLLVFVHLFGATALMLLASPIFSPLFSSSPEASCSDDLAELIHLLKNFDEERGRKTTDAEWDRIITRVKLITEHSSRLTLLDHEFNEGKHRTSRNFVIEPGNPPSRKHPPGAVIIRDWGYLEEKWIPLAITLLEERAAQENAQIQFGPNEKQVLEALKVRALLEWRKFRAPPIERRDVSTLPEEMAQNIEAYLRKQSDWTVALDLIEGIKNHPAWLTFFKNLFLSSPDFAAALPASDTRLVASLPLLRSGKLQLQNVYGKSPSRALRHLYYRFNLIYRAVLEEIINPTALRSAKAFHPRRSTRDGDWFVILAGAELRIWMKNNEIDSMSLRSHGQVHVQNLPVRAEPVPPPPPPPPPPPNTFVPIPLPIARTPLNPEEIAWKELTSEFSSKSIEVLEPLAAFYKQEADFLSQQLLPLLADSMELLESRHGARIISKITHWLKRPENFSVGMRLVLIQELLDQKQKLLNEENAKNPSSPFTAPSTVIELPVEFARNGHDIPWNEMLKVFERMGWLPLEHKNASHRLLRHQETGHTLTFVYYGNQYPLHFARQHYREAVRLIGGNFKRGSD